MLGWVLIDAPAVTGAHVLLRTIFRWVLKTAPVETWYLLLGHVVPLAAVKIVDSLGSVHCKSMGPVACTAWTVMRCHSGSLAMNM